MKNIKLICSFFICFGVSTFAQHVLPAIDNLNNKIDKNTGFTSKVVQHQTNKERVSFDRRNMQQALGQCINPTITSSISANRCGPGLITISATPSAGTVAWFTSATGGSPLVSNSAFTINGNDLTINNMNFTTIFYAEAQDGACVSETRTAVVATNSRPVVLFTANPLPICSGTSSLLTADVRASISTSSQIFHMSPAIFGNPINAPISGVLALAPSNGCTPFTPGLFAGKIALIQRGSCSFALKAEHAQAAGAVAVIVYNNVEGLLTPGGTSLDVTIPVYGIRTADGQSLINAMTANEVNVTLQPTPSVTYLWGTGATTPTINTGALTSNTTFGITITNTLTSCSLTTSVTAPVTQLSTPIFTQVAPICSGSPLSALPTTSNNGITGTWSPAVDNIITTTYTFTPTAGLCSTTRTMTITVNPIPTAPNILAQTLPFGSTAAQLYAIEDNLFWYDVEIDGSPIFSTTPLETGTYYVSQMVNGCQSPRTAVSVVIEDEILTAVRPSQCGLILAANNGSNVVNAIPLPSAVSYDFEVTVEGSSPEVVTTPDSFFRFNQLSAIPGLSKKISIRVAFTDTIQRPYGTSCDLFTKTQITQLRFSQCGITVPANNGTVVVNAIPVLGATSYDFEVMRNGGNMQVINTTNAFITFNQLNTLPASSTILSIRVRATVNNILGEWGNACNIFTRTQINSIRASQCGLTIPANNGSVVINANPVAGATTYQFGVTVNGGAEQLISTAQNFFNFSQLNALPGLGSTISVRVRATVNTITADWSASCTVFTTAMMDEEFVEISKVDFATAYPNPFSNQFKLKLANNSEASIQVFDITGQLISNQTVNDIDEVEFGQNLETGVYLVRIEQNGDIQNIKMIKI